MHLWQSWHSRRRCRWLGVGSWISWPPRLAPAGFRVAWRDSSRAGVRRAQPGWGRACTHPGKDIPSLERNSASRDSAGRLQPLQGSASFLVQSMSCQDTQQRCRVVVIRHNCAPGAEQAVRQGSQEHPHRLRIRLFRRCCVLESDRSIESGCAGIDCSRWRFLQCMPCLDKSGTAGDNEPA